MQGYSVLQYSITMNRRRYLRDFLCKGSKALDQAYPLTNKKFTPISLSDKSEAELEGVALELAELMQEAMLILAGLDLAGNDKALPLASTIRRVQTAFLNNRQIN